MLDTANLHVSKVTKAARPALAGASVYLYYLPAYSPELNRIEAVFKTAGSRAAASATGTRPGPGIGWR